MTQTALYRHWDAEGRLLYVGISIDPNRRLREHSYESDWFDRVVTVKIERFATQAEAASAERAAVIAEKPENNTIRFGGRKRPYLHPAGLATGDQKPTSVLRRAILDRICTPTGNWRSLDGCADLLLVAPDLLESCIQFPKRGPQRIDVNDMLALGDRVLRGTLVSLAPWIVGSPLPEHMTCAPKKRVAA